MTRPALTAVFAALLTALCVACGGSESESEGSTTPTATETTNGGIDTLEGAGTQPVTGDAEAEGTALHERLALGRHEGYDRVVFQFKNHRPGFRVEYVQPPLHEDGSGNTVEIAGNAFVLVRMEPASGFDVETGEGELVYTGARRISGAGAGTSTVREVVRTGDFEAVLSWAVGLEDRVDFRVLTLDEPPRLVIDFRNH